MHILAINGSHRPDKTTTRLAQAALEGAAAGGASTELVQLCEQDVQFCTNCLTCYKDLESEIAPCVLDDDVTTILEKLKAADGVLWASPVHNGFVSGRLTAFMERAVWRLCRPTGEIMGLKGLPMPRLTDKPRASASLMNAGAMPVELRQYCDQGTPWLQGIVPMLCNGPFVADIYVGAQYPRLPEEDEWSRAYLLRELSESQLQQAADLGKNLAGAVAAGLHPFDVSMMLPPEV